MDVKEKMKYILQYPIGSELQVMQVIGYVEKLEKQNAKLEARIAELEAYADKLAAGLPEGMLPKDVENLREANASMADRIAELEEAFDYVEREKEAFRKKCAELEAEAERLRWHYPDNGELPKSPEMDIVAEISPTGSKNHHTFYECLLVTDELELFDEWRDKMWNAKYIVRWRYVI